MKVIVCRTIKVGVVAIQEPMLREDLSVLFSQPRVNHQFYLFFALKKIYILGNKIYQYILVLAVTCNNKTGSPRSRRARKHDGKSR